MVGCVRSGTTLLRDILKSSPRLHCPEETHYYRWGYPFGNNGYVKNLNSALLKRHRSMDGVDEGRFQDILTAAKSRHDFQQRYMNEFLTAQDRAGARWFDKSPQNIYGLPLLAHDYPQAQFVHIVRNPLNVVASLIVGKVISAPNVVAAANFWREAVAIFNTFRPVIEMRTCELRYEDLTSHPSRELRRLMSFLDEDVASLKFKISTIHPEKDQFRSVLSSEDIAVVAEICGEWAEHYGYDLS